VRDAARRHMSAAPAREMSAPASQRQAQAMRAAVLAASNEHVCCVSDGALHVLTTASPECDFTLQPSLLSCACFDAAGNYLLAGGGDKQIALWRLVDVSSSASATAAPIRRWTHGKKVGCVAFSPDGGMALWADLFGEVHGVVLTDEDAAPALLLGHLSPVSHLCFSADGGAVVTSDREGHVRSSHWPHAFVIECYYLEHTTPLQLLLALRHTPLIVTAASDGREVCYWRAHSGALLGKTRTMKLLAVEGAVEGAGSECDDDAAIIGGCEVGGCTPLIALALSGRAAVHFCAARCEWDGSSAQLLPKPELTFALPEAPLALAYSVGSACLCALLPSGTLTLIPAASDGRAAFDAKRARTVLTASPLSAKPSAAEDEQGEGSVSID